MSNAFSDLFASAKFFQSDGQGVGVSRSIYQPLKTLSETVEVETAGGNPAFTILTTIGVVGGSVGSPTRGPALTPAGQWPFHLHTNVVSVLVDEATFGNDAERSALRKLLGLVS